MQNFWLIFWLPLAVIAAWVEFMICVIAFALLYALLIVAVFAPILFLGVALWLLAFGLIFLLSAPARLLTWVIKGRKQREKTIGQVGVRGTKHPLSLSLPAI
jgi:hypothetical protein